MSLRLVPNKKISMFQVKELKILGRVRKHTYFFLFVCWGGGGGGGNNLMHFERHFPFQNG